MSTKVIFRKFKDGDVIALFPTIAGDYNPYVTCQSYQHIGQHGAASVDLVYSTKLATPDEFKALQDELVSIGYNDLKVSYKFTYKDLQARKEQVKR